MLNIKDITNDQILLQIETLRNLYVEYKENKPRGQCPLCITREEIETHKVCNSCPWMWITGDTCLSNVYRWRIKNAIDPSDMSCFAGQVPEWNKYRMRQIKRWIKKLEEVVNDNR